MHPQIYAAFNIDPLGNLNGTYTLKHTHTLSHTHTHKERLAVPLLLCCCFLAPSADEVTDSQPQLYVIDRNWTSQMGQVPHLLYYVITSDRYHMKYVTSVPQ